MKKTLLWHPGALGDLLLSLPAIHAIKLDTGTEHLHLVSRTDLHEILFANGFIDEASSHDSGSFSPLFGNESLPEKLRDFLLEFNAAFIFTRSADAAVFRQISRCIPRSFHIRTVPPAGEIVHVSDFQLAGLASAGVRLTAGMPVLDAGPHPDRNTAREMVTFHPGSGGRAKCWPLENYLDCISVISGWGKHDVRVLLGPAEDGEFFRATVEGMEKRVIRADIVTNESISYIASLLKSSSLHIGNDSGITHLAAALGVPTVALFGPTDCRLWGPAGKKAKIVRSGVSCSPCAGERFRRCEKRRCLETIGVRSVMKETDGLLLRP